MTNQIKMDIWLIYAIIKYFTSYLRAVILVIKGENNVFDYSTMFTSPSAFVYVTQVSRIFACAKKWFG